MPDNQPSQFQRILTALAASILVFYLWVFLYQKIWPPPAPQTQPSGATTAPAPATQSAATASPGTQQAGGQQATTSAISSSGKLIVVGGESTTDVMLGDATKGNPYPMAVELSPRGASIKQARLRGYYETVEREQPYVVCQPYVEQGRESFSLETHHIRFVELDEEVRLDSVVWKIDQATDQQVVFSVQIDQPNKLPLARVVKTYRLPQQPAKPDTKGETHDLTLNTVIENLTDHPLQAVLVQQGPVGFRQAKMLSKSGKSGTGIVSQEDRAVIAALYETGREGQEPQAKIHYRKELTADKEWIELGRDDDVHRIAWVAETNQYFTFILTPAERKGTSDPPLFDRAEVLRLSAAAENHGEDLTFRYVTRPLTIQPGGQQHVQFDCYIGPKSKKVFDSVPKYQAHNYYAVITTSFYFCAPTALVGVMMTLLDAFHRIPPHNYGISIFLLVIVVRAILHPITKRSQVNMMKMQKQMATLQPKLAVVKEKYANDRAALNQATMEVYREAGINPAGNILTCIPMMLQIPIWAALWAALNSTVEMRHAPLDGFWIKDLTQPDALFHFSTPITIPLVSYIMGGPMTALNLLPVLLAITQLLQAKYMPRSGAPAASDNPDQMEQQRKMMMFMSIFFLFMFYNMPSGLNLYIMTSNLAGIVEQWRIRKHIEEEERKGKFAPVTAGPKPKGWLHRKWEQLQKEADEARRLQSDRPKRKR